VLCEALFTARKLNSTGQELRPCALQWERSLHTPPVHWLLFVNGSLGTVVCELVV